MTAISDTSPLVLLAKIGQLQLLRQVYGNVLIPPAVHAEIQRGGATAEDVATIQATDWVSVRPLRDLRAAPPGTAGLGAGERDAIALALEIDGDITVVVDDLQGRRTAAALGVGLIGTVGVLLAAKRIGFISEIRPTLDALLAAGLYLSDQEYRRALALAGE